MKVHKAAVISLVGSLAVAVALHAAPIHNSWPMFRGNPGQTGIASGNLPSALRLRWKFKTKDAITSSPAIAHGRAYIGSNDGSVYALKLGNGQKVWSFKTGDAVEAPPLVIGRSVVVGSSDEYLYSLNADTGKLRWKYKTGDKILGGANWFAARGGKIRILIGSYDNKLHCVDASSGKMV